MLAIVSIAVGHRRVRAAVEWVEVENVHG
jgi:hypothetical protein